MSIDNNLIIVLIDEWIELKNTARKYYDKYSLEKNQQIENQFKIMTSYYEKEQNTDFSILYKTSAFQKTVKRIDRLVNVMKDLKDLKDMRLDRDDLVHELGGCITENNEEKLKLPFFRLLEELNKYQKERIVANGMKERKGKTRRGDKVKSIIKQLEKTNKLFIEEFNFDIGLGSFNNAFMNEEIRKFMEVQKTIIEELNQYKVSNSNSFKINTKYKYIDGFVAKNSIAPSTKVAKNTFINQLLKESDISYRKYELSIAITNLLE